MSELRQDKTTGAWVIISPNRGRRPSDSLAGGCTPYSARSFDPACPFCPGHEAELPGIFAETPASEAPGWWVRVVPNKYPAVRSDTTATSPADPSHLIVGGYGQHEVVIESPWHDDDLASMSDAQRDAVIFIYHRRYRHLIADAQVESVILFRNHGRAGGASLRHPHAQLIALGMIPPRLQSMIAWAGHRYSGTRRCVTCDEIAFERSDQQRIIEETERFLALVPFAATVPCEIWLVPKRHEASFAAMDQGECRDLGKLLRRSLRRLAAVHGAPPYNLIVDSAGRSDQDSAAFHWRLRIVPDLVTWGGFERGTDLPINPSLPEQDAALLRAAAMPEGLVR
jgi:UDPglucose--hexose-1-phosphate uridylyltransferase